MKRIHIILFILGALGCLSSCKPEDRSYNGPLFVEFCPDRYGQTASPSGIIKTAPGIGQDTIGVQLIGLAQTEPLTVNFRLADQIFYLISLDRYVADLPDNVAQGDYQTIFASGKYNEDYSFDGLTGVTFDKTYGRGSFTVPPNSQFGVIPIHVIQKGGAQIFIVLENSENLQVNVPTALLRYQTPLDRLVLLDESFASDPFSRGWTEIDRDGDGYNWVWYDNPPCITSDSWLDGDITLTPENYLISPAIAIPAAAQNVALAFQLAAGASGTDYKEHFKVIISESAITFDNCRNATILQDWTELTDANRGKKFTDISVDMTAYKGKTVYIGIVHGDCTGMYYILLRNLSVYTY